MKFLTKFIVVIGAFISLSSHALDLSKIPDIRDANIETVNEDGFQRDERPKHCTYNGSERGDDPKCYDFVLSQREAFGNYAKEGYRLGKPLEKGNKAKENLAGLEAIIDKIERVYNGTEKAIINKKANLNLSLAGLFNVFNNAITDVEPYVLSIAKGHYDKATLKKLDSFMNVFQNGWNRSVSAMVKFEGITQDDADNSTKYYRQELIKIRHIITQLNKYYQ